MPSSLNMLEYLEHLGIDIEQYVNEKSIRKEYLRQIYRLDSREKIIDSRGKIKGKSSNPRHLH